MNKKRLILLLISLLFIIIPFFINIYSIYKLLSVILGIILLDVFLATSKKTNIFLLIYLPILLLIFTYSIDYIKTYTLEMSPIFIWKNKINDKVSLYNSLFYRIYKCDDQYIFDNEYQKGFACDTKLIANIDVNKLLNEPEKSYHKYHNDFIKVTGKISKISGKSSIELREYTTKDGVVNGYVEFNNNSRLVVNVNDNILTNYKIYDYITVVGLVDSFNKRDNTLTLINTKVEENNLYDEYVYQVIEANNCDNLLKEYSDTFYVKCLNNIYLDYKIDKYELSYALKDGKITYDDIIKDAMVKNKGNYKLYNLEKFKIIECNKDKKILLNNNELEDYSWCEE